MMLRGLSIFIFCAVALSAEEARWKYGETDSSGLGPKDWGRVWKYCSEKAQSPINIITHTALKNPDLRGLRFTSDNRDGKVSGILSNNGHAPTLSINKIKGTATLTGGPLGKRLYKLEQFHFHFGCKENRGSEHTLNGYSFSGEIHLVSYNTKYGNFGAAARKPDGLAVIGVFFQGSDDEDRDDDEKNSELCKLSKLFRRIKNPGSKTTADLALYKLVPGLADLSSTPFFSYKGSLTTPPCYQSVSWIVLERKISAGENDLREMRYLRNHERHSICDNFRPVQPLNRRTVSKYSG